MAGQFYNPFPQFSDSASVLYANGSLEFFQSGTSTPLAVYSDAELQNTLGVTVALNAAGRPANQIFLQDRDYKVVLKDADGNEIWTADPVFARDQALVVKTLTGSGSPTGSVAGTAGSSGVLPDFYWDYTNSVLYVCTVTGTSSTAVWTAINASAATPSVPPPQGRLTLTSGTPVLSTGVAAATAIYYTPFVGNLVPIYNGAAMTPTEFSELTLTLSSSHVASSFYDVFVFSDSGVLTLATGPAWTTTTAGSGARGTGASTTELTRVKGLWVNAVQIAARNGSTTYTIGANLATYVGSIQMDGSNGQITCHTAFGQNRKWGVWNAYNQMPVVLMTGDGTSSWTYTTNTWRPSNNSTSNKLTVFQGLPNSAPVIDFTQQTTPAFSAAQGSSVTNIGIGVNSTTSPSGLVGVNTLSMSGTGLNFNQALQSMARYTLAPGIGTNDITCLERTAITTNSGSISATFSGSSELMTMRAIYLA